MYCKQWSLSAGLFSCPDLEMILIADSWVVTSILAISSSLSLIWGCNVTAASTAVCAWNSAGKLILKRTFSITYEPKGWLRDNFSPLNETSSKPHVGADKTLG